MTHATPDEPTDEDPLATDRDAEDVVNEELPLDPAGPTELGDAVDD